MSDFVHPPTPHQPTYYPVQQPSPRRALGCMFLVALGLFVSFFGMCFLSSLLAGGGGAAGGVSEEKLQGEGDAKIALISLEGVIAQKVGGGFLGIGYDLVQRLQQQFDRAAKDDAVKGVLLRIDSPGGTVTASDQIWHLVKQFRAKSKKPVVVHMGGVAASGGYYISVAADAIYCEPTTITGSIGVILSTLNFHELLKKYGVKDVTITSGENKALLSATGEVKESHQKILQNMVDTTHARFVKLVAEGRSLELKKAEEIADGRIYTAQQAVDLKLVDGIGYLADTFEQVKKLAGAGKARLVRYKHQPTFAEMLSARSAPAVDLRSLETLNSPRLLALWRGR